MGIIGFMLGLDLQRILPAFLELDKWFWGKGNGLDITLGF
jgi:hypothetical protein